VLRTGDCERSKVEVVGPEGVSPSQLSQCPRDVLLTLDIHLDDVGLDVSLVFDDSFFSLVFHQLVFLF
jgi:hypothetical protein